MFLLVTGVSHDTAPIELREQLAMSSDQLASALGDARTYGAERVILSTCNRFEVYLYGERPESSGVMGEMFERLPVGIEHLYRHDGLGAVAHLLRVASGVDSLVLGEVQILGQVQRAWQAAHQAGAAGPVLSQLFHKAVALGKRVHSETAISRHPASVSYAAVVLARRIFGSQLTDRKAVVIGTGEVGEGVARCLHDYGVRPVVVAHRRSDRAENIARRYEADTAGWDELSEQLAGADIVISSTAAPHYVLQRQHIEDAVSRRNERPLYLIDLAVPRDIDPASSELPGVYLHNVDDLQSVVQTSLKERESALPEIEAMISVEVVKFADWLRSRTTAPTIRELQAQAQMITRNELAWALGKLEGLDERQMRVVEALASRVASKMMHGPIQWLKAQAESGRFHGEMPDYGMSKLSAAELQDLFYRSVSNITSFQEGM